MNTKCNYNLDEFHNNSTLILSNINLQFNIVLPLTKLFRLSSLYKFTFCIS